jgi:hypothetical protein
MPADMIMFVSGFVQRFSLCSPALQGRHPAWHADFTETNGGGANGTFMRLAIPQVGQLFMQGSSGSDVWEYSSLSIMFLLLARSIN